MDLFTRSLERLPHLVEIEFVEAWAELPLLVTSHAPDHEINEWMGVRWWMGEIRPDRVPGIFPEVVTRRGVGWHVFEVDDGMVVFAMVWDEARRDFVHRVLTSDTVAATKLLLMVDIFRAEAARR